MPEPKKNEINVEPGTVAVIVFVFILLPLLLTGFLSQ